MSFKKLSKAEHKQILNDLLEMQTIECPKCGSNLKKLKNHKGICSWRGCKYRVGKYEETILKNLKVKKKESFF